MADFQAMGGPADGDSGLADICDGGEGYGVQTAADDREEERSVQGLYLSTGWLLASQISSQLGVPLRTDNGLINYLHLLLALKLESSPH